MKLKTMPNVRSCSVTECAYNSRRRCRAGAVTVDSPEPMCDTFFRSHRKGGIKHDGAVGACKNDKCVYNELYECNAESIMVSMHSDRPACDTFTQRRVSEETWDV